MLDLKRLHAIRGFASFYVVIYHAKFVLWCGGTEYLRAFPRESWSPFSYLLFGLDLLSSAGQQMVVAFFVLSGFFLTRSLDEKGTRGFYRNRVVRIYIPYIAALLFGALVLYVVHAGAPALFTDQPGRELNTRMLAAFESLHWKNFALALFFMQDREYLGFNFPFWSLACEAIFYLTIPFLYTRARAFVAVSALLTAAGFLAPGFVSSLPVPSYFFRFQLYFALGVLAWQERSWFLRAILPGWWLFTAALGGLALMLLLALLRRDDAANLVSGGVTLLLLGHLPFQAASGKIRAAIWRFFEWVGKISYSLYITHLPVLLLAYLALHTLTGELVLYRRYYPLGVLAAFLFSLLFFRLFELPSLRLLARGQARNRLDTVEAR